MASVLVVVFYVVTLVLIPLVIGIAYLYEQTNFFDSILVWTKARWYSAIIDRLQSQQRLLDVGNGTATALKDSVHSILTKGIAVVCLERTSKDITNIQVAMLGAGINTHRESNVVYHRKALHDIRLQELFIGDKQFDAICFSRPLMQFPDPVASLRIAASLLKDGGSIYVPNVVSDEFFNRLKKWVPFALRRMPLARYTDVRNVSSEAGLEISNDLPTFGVEDKKEARTSRMLVLQRSVASCKVGQGEGYVRSRKKVEENL